MLTTADIAHEFTRVRCQSTDLCEPLCIEDYGLQAIAETSPPKWHLAHTAWFFETFLLKEFVAGYQPDNDAFEFLFNSYYNHVGEQYARSQRGLLSRPTVDEVYAYRSVVDDHILELLTDTGHKNRADILQRVELGLHHEMQHQELLLTDLKYSLAQNPLFPSYRESTSAPGRRSRVPLEYVGYEGGVVDVGAKFDAAEFCFDNETPPHKVYLTPYQLANRLTTNEEYLGFIEDGGYRRADLWLADGWTTVQAQGWQAPLYWQRRQEEWHTYTLNGLIPLDPLAPVCHVSYYEAEAFARWAEARLPSEPEWEHAARQQEVTGHFLGMNRLQPQRAKDMGGGMQQMFGDVWEWTGSSYAPYPDFAPHPGAIGEYNGKFMCNQKVLRGGSCVSDERHVRASYRNFFYPPDRWQFSGIRLARSIK